jgi:hypothetical protein
MKPVPELIENRRLKESPHHEMSMAERGLRVTAEIRLPWWNAQSSLNCPDKALSRPSRATAGSMTRNTKSVPEASENKSNPLNETAEGMVRDPDRLTEPVWARRDNGVAVSISSLRTDGAPWVKRVV